MSSVSAITVHPKADIFPMMSEEELQELANDIKENGLIHPIMLSSDGKELIDGRNREKACQIAGVEPRYERLNGQDPIAFIASANLQRRNLNNGQRAVLMAVLYPEPEQGKRTDLKGTSFKMKEVTGRDLSHARMIVNEAKDLVTAVIAGGMYFKAAFEEATKRKRAAELVAAQMRLLKEQAPDLADIVLEEKGMTAAEAIAALEERKRQEAAHLDELQRLEQERIADERQHTERRTRVIAEAMAHFNPHGCTPQEYATRILSEIDIAFWPQINMCDSSIETWKACGNALLELANQRLLADHAESIRVRYQELPTDVKDLLNE